MLDSEKPRIEIVEHRPEENYMKFVVEPLEKGFGTTLGNALRRVMLWYVPGAAVKNIKIDGIMHEFSTIRGVKEDVVDIILNLKTLAIKMTDEGPKTMRISAKGPCTVTAADIESDIEVEIVNKDLHIATLNEDADFYMEMTVDKGRGFVVAEKNKEDIIGLIPIDAVYSPITKVNFYVEDTRVGNVTDYDKLTLEVWTNGAIEPQEAVSYSAKVLCDYLGLFVDLTDTSETFEVAKVESDSTSNKMADMPIEELELSVRSYNCLKRANINTIGELLLKSEEEMIKVRNLGKKSLDEVMQKLQSLGFTLKKSEE
ncbi:MAG: DNA-directed RNA polymerase subunit alpha [Clostridiales bacterium]|nr:DNA-directed RNA polymerase subunit alpha [Clostridiales bacterium]